MKICLLTVEGVETDMGPAEAQQESDLRVARAREGGSLSSQKIANLLWNRHQQAG